MALIYVILGGGGFLGANLVAAFQENGVFVKFIIVDPNPRLMSFTHLNIDESYIEYEKSSFLEEAVLDRVLPGAAAVFHLSAIGHTGKFGARRHREYVHYFNVIGTQQLLDKCRQHNVRRFIYASSVAVCFTGKPIVEKTEKEPYPLPGEYLDIYSSTKAEAEKLVRSSSTNDLKTTCLRFRAIYGPMDVSVAQKVVDMVQRNLLRFKISRNGSETRTNMSSGRNCGLSMLLADRALQTKATHGQVYNITDGVTVGQYSVWSPLIKALGKNPPNRFVSYGIVSAFVSLSSYLCFEIFNAGPPLTRFELEVLVTENTYCIEKARRELDYKPGENHFEETCQYYHQNAEKVGHSCLPEFHELIIIVLTVIVFVVTFSCC